MAKKRQTIAVDLDDVLGNEKEAVRLFINERFGFNHTPEDYLVDGEYWGYWESVWGQDTEKGEEMHQAYIDAGAKGRHEPVTGAFEAIEKLKRKFNLIIITSRGDKHVQITKVWLQNHFPDVFKRVEFIPLWGERKVITKAYIAKQLGAEFLIDDNYEHCEQAVEAGLETILFGTYGWNRRYRHLPSGMTRCDNWAEVLEYFDGKG
jgi:uncharacterized HAD superfamily protein